MKIISVVVFDVFEVICELVKFNVPEMEFR